MKKNNTNVLIRFFNGELSLAQSYWGFLTLGGLILFFLFSFLFGITLNYFFKYLLVLFFYLMLIILNIGAWRSASNYKKQKIKKKQGYGWGIAAQVTIVLGIIRLIVDILKSS